ncbi:MAG TPA: hypothetical protein VEV45_20905 [Streptosporangiaceae bacterium]|nr:hypothetical protein [Streptosporangiaceae bacterium]
MSDAAPRYVSYDRWDATNQEITRRLGALERDAIGLRGAEQEHRSLEDRLDALEGASREHETSMRGRRDRAWVIVLAVTTGIVCPLIVTAVITLIHLRSLG